MADLPDAETKAIYAAMKNVLLVAVRRNADVSQLPPSYLLPRRGQDKAMCPKCDGTIRKRKIGGRTTHYCPECQARS